MAKTILSCIEVEGKFMKNLTKINVAVVIRYTHVCILLFISLFLIYVSAEAQELGEQIHYSGIGGTGGTLDLDIKFETNNKVSGVAKFGNIWMVFASKLSGHCGSGTFTGVRDEKTIRFSFVSDGSRGSGFDCAPDKGVTVSVNITRYSDYHLSGNYEMTRDGKSLEKDAFYITADCPEPPKYRLAFVGRESNAEPNANFEHSYVIFETFNEITEKYDKQPYGFFANGTTMGNLLKVSFGSSGIGASGGVDQIDSLNFNRKGFYSITIPVSEETFKRATTVKKQWEISSQVGTMEYNIFLHNCVQFVDEIARAVGDRVDTNSISYTPPLNIEGDDGKFTYPVNYIKSLINLNAKRAVPDIPKKCHRF